MKFRPNRPEKASPSAGSSAGPRARPTSPCGSLSSPPGSYSPHQHPYEHEIFVLEGEGVAEGPDGEHPMRPGVALYIPPNERHGYRNTGPGPLRFICVIPHPEAS